jgi:tetratricopeptide (TPR) repeat protein
MRIVAIMSNAVEQLAKMGRAHQQFVLENDLEKAKSVTDKFETMVHSFRGFNDPRYDQNVWLDIAEKLIALEKELVHLDFLSFLYAKTGRALLNAGKTQRAITYANAGIEVNEHNNDQEGVAANYQLLADIAASESYFRATLELLKKSGTSEHSPIFEAITGMVGQDKSKKTMDSFIKDARPPSFKYAIGKAKERETRIRFVQYVMQDCSRKEAITYVDHAERIAEKDK